MEFLIAIIPSLGVLFLFWLGIRALVQADRRERIAQARLEASADQQADQPPEPPESDAPDGIHDDSGNPGQHAV